MARSLSTLSRKVAASSTATATLVPPAALFPLSQRLMADLNNNLDGGCGRTVSIRSKRNESTQTNRFQHQNEPASTSSMRSHVSIAAGCSSLSAHVTSSHNNVTSTSADNHSSRATSTRREAGSNSGGGSSSFDTSATQVRGGMGDGSSSDLSMSSPPLPPTFDFVVKNAKGEG